MKINYLVYNLFAVLLITSATVQAQINNKLKDTTIRFNRKRIDNIDRKMIESWGSERDVLKK